MSVLPGRDGNGDDLDVISVHHTVSSKLSCNRLLERVLEGQSRTRASVGVNERVGQG